MHQPSIDFSETQLAACCLRSTCIRHVLPLEFVIPMAIRGSRLLQIAHVVSPNLEVEAGE